MAFLALNGKCEIAAKIPRSAPLALENMGGKSLRATDAVINGHPGEVRIFAVMRDAEDVARDLSVAAGLAFDKGAGLGASYMLDFPAPGGGALTRTLVLPGRDGSALAILVELPAHRIPDNPSWPWNDLQAPAGLQTEFSATLENGRIGFIAASAPHGETASRRLLAERLSDAGWTCVTPAAETISSALYSRKGETLLTTVLPGPTGGSRVSILRHRPR